jgi:hypothetical protein
MSQPVNNTTGPSVDYLPFPMVVPSSRDPIAKKYQSDKIKQLKELVTLATERGVLQQLVNAATTQDEVLIQPDKETDLNRLIRENKKNEILSIKANQAIINDQVEKTVISRRKKDRAVKAFNDNYKPIKDFKGDLSEFIGVPFDALEVYERPESVQAFNEIYTTLEQLKFPINEIEDLKTAVNQAPQWPTPKQSNSVLNIRTRLQALKRNAKSTLKKDLSNLPEITQLNATLDIFITLMDEILTIRERSELADDVYKTATSPSFQQNFGSVLNPPGQSIPSEYRQEVDMQEAEDYSLAPAERNLVQSIVPTPPPLPQAKKPLKIIPLARTLTKPVEIDPATMAAQRSRLRPAVLASATPVRAGVFVDDVETTGDKVEIGSPRYEQLRQRYGVDRTGAFVARQSDVLMNVLRDRIAAKNRKFNNEDSVLDGDAFGTSGTGFRKLKPMQERLVRAHNKGKEYKVDEEGMIGDVQIDLKKLKANVLKAKKGKKVLMQKPLSDGLRSLLTKRFNKNMKYTQEDLNDFATICKEAEVPIKGGNLKAEIIKGTIKPTKESKKVKLVYYNTPEELETRLKVLCGSIDAGNGSPELKEEATQILDIMKGHGMMSETNVQTLVDSWL